MISILKFSFLSLILIITATDTIAQSNNPDKIPYRYWIYFKDKGEFKPGIKLEKGTKAYELASMNLTPKALWRRGKVLSEDKIIRYEDLPVNQAYIDEIKKLKIYPVSISKWFNGITVIVKKDELNKLLKLPFVQKAEGVGVLYFPSVNNNSGKNFNHKIIEPQGYKYNYGRSFWQNEQIKVPELHNYGVTGLGVTIGMCDDGFNWRHQIALKNRKVLGEYDWIMRDDSTQNQFPDHWDQDGHGTATMSCVGGFYEGEMIGAAFDAEFYLSKTENDFNETPVEEDFWLEAVEWMESKGIEVLSSSLIYKPFDDPNNDYTYKDMNGRTTVIARAGNMAAYLGIVVLNSMGNERQTNPPSVVSPPDADSVIAVGAVDSAGYIAYFSSNGPTSDGRIKPDVVAMGEFVWAATSRTVSLDDTTFSNTSGTSFSCPITAGVAAQILSIHPELTPMQVREALRMTANKSSHPDNVYGWGLVNAFDASLYFGAYLSSTPEVRFNNDDVTISTYMLSKEGSNGVKLFISTDGTENFTEYFMEREETDNSYSVKYKMTIPYYQNNLFLKFYFIGNNDSKEIISPFNAPDNFYIYRDKNKGLELILNY